MSRNNVSDNFEACYLKENIARKAFKNPLVTQILATPDFDRSVRFMAHVIFKRNESVLLAHGFHYDDVLNVCKIWGLQYFNYNPDCKTEQDVYRLIMRFIGQRANTFFLFMNRKFRINESYVEMHLEDLQGNENESRRWLSFVNRNSGYKVPDAEIMTEDQEQATIKETAKERRTKIEAMRNNLNKNIGQHTARLSELATSKAIDFQVRKKARQMCKKHNIDYIAWAKDQIQSRNLNETDFVLE